MSFRLKIILGIVFIEGLLLLALVISSLAYLRDSNQQELQRRAATVANPFAAATKDAVLAPNLTRLEQLASGFLKNPGVFYVRITGLDRVLVKAGAAKPLQQPFQADSTLDLVDDGIYDTFAIIREAGPDYGRVEPGLSVESIKAVINEACQRIVILAALEMGLVALFSWLMVSYFTRQLTGLEAASKRVANGEFSPQLPVRGCDELARVTKSFNSMSEHVDRIYHELQLALSEAKLRGERLQGVVDSVMDGLIAIDKKGSVTLFSHSSEQIFGYLADEVMGRNVNMLMPESYHSAHDQYLQNYLNNGERRIFGIFRLYTG